jgi:hypothetical protein
MMGEDPSPAEQLEAMNAEQLAEKFADLQRRYDSRYKR